MMPTVNAEPAAPRPSAGAGSAGYVGAAAVVVALPP